uniref:Uncharacterized protein n=1 Tax=Arundo donax TaxID=35708 RepID=A0A0A9BIZ5_ARUDO
MEAPEVPCLEAPELAVPPSKPRNWSWVPKGYASTKICHGDPANYVAFALFF